MYLETSKQFYDAISSCEKAKLLRLEYENQLKSQRRLLKKKRINAYHIKNDELTNELKEKVEKIIEGMEGKVSFHDFRIVKGPTHTNLIFDILLPYEYSMTDEQVVAYLKEKIAEIDPTYQAVIDVDKAYV